MSRIYNKFHQVERDSPQLMLNFIYTVKQLAGPLKVFVATKDTLEEIFGCLVTKYVHGSAGLMRLYNMKSMKESYALDTGTYIHNIEEFLKTTHVVQQLDIMDKVMDVLVSTLADCIFLYDDLQKWHKYCAQHERVKPLESASESKVLRVNQTMLADATYNPALEWSDNDDLEVSIAKNTIE